VLATYFGTAVTSWAFGDFDGSGLVDGADFNLLASYFGNTSELSAAQQAAWDALSIPAPGVASCAALFGGLALLRRRDAASSVAH